MNEIITLLPLITVFIIFYVILYIPQRRRQKKHKEYVENLKIGDNVITDSGIYGRVVNIKEDKVTITHTLTSMLCPAADEISNNIKEATERVAGKGNVKVVITHTPPFSRDMLSEEAKLILNL